MTRVLFEAITALLPPKSVEHGDPSATLAGCIEKYLAVASPDETTINRIAGSEVHEAYCTCCIHHLQAYVDLDASSTTEELLLSVTHLDKLKSCVEFLICLGVYPYLDPGVSVPLEFRMEAHSCFRLPPVPCPALREQHLLRFAKCLLQFRACHTEPLKRLMSPALFLGDVIAALMQAGYGGPAGSNLPTQTKPEPPSASLESSREARQILWKLLCDLPGSVAMKELLILQGGSVASQKIKGAVKLPPAPVWLRKTCGRLLSRLLVRGSTQPGPHSATGGGVHSLLFASASLAPGVIGAMSSGGCITELDPRLQPNLAQGLARILASRPSWLSSSRPGEPQEVDPVERYFQSIANQVLDLFTLKFTCLPADPSVLASGTMADAVARFGGLVGVATVHELCTRDVALGRRLLLKPLLTVLYACVAPDEDGDHTDRTVPVSIPDCTDECELASVRQWNRVVDHVYSLVNYPSRSRDVMTELISLSNPLFRLLTQIHLDRIDSLSPEDPDAPMEPVAHPSGMEDASSSIATLLSQLLKTGLETRESQVALLRSWALLNSSTPVTLHPCHPRLRFRPPQPVRPLEAAVDDSIDPNVACPVPFRCVLTRESPDWLKSPYALTALIEATMDVLDRLAPASTAAASSSTVEDVQAVPIPSFETAFCGLNQSSEPASTSCLPSDLFLTLIADLNENLSRLLIGPLQSRSPTVTIRPDPGLCRPDEARAAVISSMLAASMLDRMGDRIWPQDPGQLVQLFEMTLDRLSLLIGQTDNNEESCTFLAETLSQLLGILAFYANQIGPSSTCATSDTRDQFARLLPVLERLERVGQTRPDVLNSSQRELVHCLRVLVATRGAVKLDTELSETQSQSEEPRPVGLKLEEPIREIGFRRPLIEEQTLKEEEPTTDSSTKPEAPPSALDPVLAEVFEQLTDPLIPVRGHALIVLSRLLESRDTCVRGHEDRIFQTLVRQLNDTDSYIYLNAIRALSAMGLMRTDRVLHILLDRFAQSGATTDESKTDSRTEFRLKLGEAVMRVLRELGSMAPNYRAPVLNAMTLGTRSTEPLIRAASLSNLAEFCRLLRHAIAPILYELFALIELHLVQDPEPCVRQAAANLARSLLTPVDSSEPGLPSWLAADVLRDLNRLLSSRVRIERSEEVREQIEAALGQLDQVVRTSLFRVPDTPQALVKEIRVLRPFLD